MNEALTLREILAPSRIAAAWSKLRSNDGAAGEDTVTIRELEESLPRLWPAIEASILDGTYRPTPLRPVWIPKPGGGSRKLAIPSVADRLIQHSIASSMTPRWESRFPKASYACRPGVGAHQAVAGVLDTAALIGNPVALRLDIRDFFDRIPRGAVSGVLRETPCDASASVLIQHSLAAPVASALGPVTSTMGIPQGSPLSPLVSNAVLLPFDLTFATAPAAMFRYADDMLLLCRDERMARAMHELAVEKLGSLGLELNSEKTRILPLADCSFLGFGFTRASGGWVRDLSAETSNACLLHLARMEDSGKSPQELAEFLRQWTAYFLPTPADRERHAAFLADTCSRFRLAASPTRGKSRQHPPVGFSYSGSSTTGASYSRLPWAVRFIARRVRFGLSFRRRGLLPVPSGLHVTIGGHRIHFRF